MEKNFGGAHPRRDQGGDELASLIPRAVVRIPKAKPGSGNNIYYVDMMHIISRI